MLHLLRERLTNEQIAARLGISLDGAKYHVSSILSKLGASTREEAAAWQPTDGRPWWKRLIATPAAILGATTLVGSIAGLGVLAWGVLETSGPTPELAGPVAAAEEGSIALTSSAEEVPEAETLLDVLSAGARNSSARNPQRRQCPDETLAHSASDDARSRPQVQRQLTCTSIGPTPLPVGPMLTPAGATPKPTARPRSATKSSATPTPPPSPSPSPTASALIMYVDTDPTWDTASCAEANPGNRLELRVSISGAPAYDDGGTPGDSQDDSGGETQYAYTLGYDTEHFDIADVSPDGRPDQDGWWTTEDEVLYSWNVAWVDAHAALDRLIIGVNPDTPFGQYHLTLLSGAIDGPADSAIEPYIDDYYEPSLTGATIAVGIRCPPEMRSYDCKLCLDAISVDADPAHNTGTSLGLQNDCSETIPGAVVEIDVTALNVPPYADFGTTDRPEFRGGLMSYAYTLLYDETILAVQAQNPNFLLAANPGSSLFDASDGIADSDGGNSFAGAVVDMSGGAPESGSGVLSRLTIAIESAARAGLYTLDFAPNTTVILDATGEAVYPRTLNNATLAVGVPCP